jgi:hypothetical protein
MLKKISSLISFPLAAAQEGVFGGRGQPFFIIRVPGGGRRSPGVGVDDAWRGGFLLGGGRSGEELQRQRRRSAARVRCTCTSMQREKSSTTPGPDSNPTGHNSATTPRRWRRRIEVRKPIKDSPPSSFSPGQTHNKPE